MLKSSLRMEAVVKAFNPEKVTLGSSSYTKRALRVLAERFDREIAETEASAAIIAAASTRIVPTQADQRNARVLARNVW